VHPCRPIGYTNQRLFSLRPPLPSPMWLLRCCMSPTHPIPRLRCVILGFVLSSVALNYLDKVPLLLVATLTDARGEMRHSLFLDSNYPLSQLWQCVITTMYTNSRHLFHFILPPLTL